MAPPRRVIGGIDVGTTNTKVMLVDHAGSVLTRVSRPTARVSDGVGVCTNADKLFDGIETMIIEAVQGIGVGATLDALCVTGVGEDGCPVGADHRPRDVAIAWNDRRADALAAVMAQRAPWQDGRSSVPLDGTRTAAKWAWLRAERGTVLTDATWIALTDYPAVRWTGVPFMSESLATRTACYDVDRRTWQSSRLVDCGAPALPVIRRGGTVIGHVTDGRILREGIATPATAIVAGGHDHPVAASAVCGDGSLAVLDSLGTCELLYVEPSTLPPVKPDTLFASSLPIRGDGHALLGVMELSACLEPLLSIEDRGIGKLMRGIMNGEPVPPKAVAVDAEPFFPWMDARAFVATGDAVSRVRAVLDGCACYTRAMLDELDCTVGKIGNVFVSGGWARSMSFLGARADVIRRTLRRVDEPQLSAYGSALLAARARGTAVSTDVLPLTVVMPSVGDAGRNDAMFSRFRAALDRHRAQTGAQHGRPSA